MKHSLSYVSFELYKNWQAQDKKIWKKINVLIKSIERDGMLDGIGKPERLKGQFSGWYSRRITQEHRLVYKVTSESILVASCKYHYE